MDLKEFDPTKAEREGFWFNCINFQTGKKDPDARVKVASVELPAFKTAVAERLNRRVDSALSKGGGRRRSVMPTVSESEEIEIKSMAEHVLLDWEGITKDGEALPCNLTNKLVVLAIPRFRAMVLEFGAEVAAGEVEGLQD